MRKILVTFLGYSMVFMAAGQNHMPPPESTRTRLNQNELRNEFFIGYNYGSLYLTNPYVSRDYENYPNVGLLKNDAYSIGGVSIGYNRTFTRVVELGILFSFENYYYPCEYGSTESGNPYLADINDRVLNEIIMLTLNYINRPLVRLYSAVGVGLTVAFSNIKGKTPGTSPETHRQLLPAGQLTLIGLRVGRSLGGFAEIGVGSVATVSGGVSYKIK